MAFVAAPDTPGRAPCVLQLLNWHKKRGTPATTPRLHCVVPHSTLNASYLVLRPIAPQQTALLDPRGAFLLQTPGTLFLWQVRPHLGVWRDTRGSAAWRCTGIWITSFYNSQGVFWSEVATVD